MVSRLLFVVGLLLLLMFSAVGGMAVAQDNELEALLAEALTTHRNNLEAWRSYSFRREVRRERLDNRGEVEWSLEFALSNTPTGSGFDEELIEVEGRAPTANELEEHREAARFTKHYLEVLEGKIDHPLASDHLTMLAILEESEYSYGGRETFDGVQAHRIDFEPTPQQKKGTAVEKLANSTAGTFWVTVEGHDLLRWQTRIIRPLKRGPIKLKTLDIKVTCQEVDGHYFASEISMDSVVSLGFGDERKRNRYRYSDFKASPTSR